MTQHRIPRTRAPHAAPPRAPPDAQSTSSAVKGETLHDTVKCLECYADAIVLRHPLQGSAATASAASAVPLLNAGDGVGEHPTQALLDLYTILSEQLRSGGGGGAGGGGIGAGGIGAGGIGSGGTGGRGGIAAKMAMAITACRTWASRRSRPPVGTGSGSGSDG